MYSTGDEFELKIDGNYENFVCLGTIKNKDCEFVICENDYGMKKVFIYNEDDEELKELNNSDFEDLLLESFERNALEEEPDYSEIYDEYEDHKFSNTNDDDEDEFDYIDDDDKFIEDLDLDIDEIDYIDDDESMFDNLDGFIDDLIEDEEDDEDDFYEDDDDYKVESKKKK